MPHKPVLLKEVISFLDPKQGEFFIDGTVNGGGHAEAILNMIKGGTFLGIELDRQLSQTFSKKVKDRGFKAGIILKNENYANIPEILKSENLPKADGLLLDLGFSSEQLESGRGFAFQKDEPLDMRYDIGTRGMGQGAWKTAAEVINQLKAEELEKIFREFGGERYSRKIAQKIVEARKKKRIVTTGELARIVKEAVPANYEHGRIHPATRVFQALRIYVNHELENLESILMRLESVVAPGGRVAIISFHSLEDWLVKNYFRDLAKAGRARPLTKKPIIAGEEEIGSNPRSRSAKLRGIVMS